MTDPSAARLPLPDYLAYPRHPLATILTAYLASLLGSLLLVTLLASVAPQAAAPDFGWLEGQGVTTLAALVLFAPLVETLILAATTSLLLRFLPPVWAILLSSFGWALAHSYQAPVWGLVIWWPFIIFTTLYVVWKQRSLAWGIAMAFTVHALQNLIPSIGLGFPGLLPSA